MSSINTGKFITLKRKEHKLTQEQLAEKLGVSSKTVSKWECGKCMPNACVIEELCKELEITINELLNGETISQDQEQLKSEKNALETLEKVERLEQERLTFIGILLITLGIANLAFSRTISGGGDMYDFISGLMLGIAVAVMLLGTFICAKSIGQYR